MNTLIPISRDDERLEAASRWVLKLDEDILTVHDKAAFNAWLDENPKNHDVLLEVAAVWDKTDALARLADFFPLEVRNHQEQVTARHRRWVIGPAIAASLVVLAVCATLLLSGLGTGFNSNSIKPTQIASYETAIGEQKTVLLPDGSEIVLNTNSQLSLAYTPSARVLHLARGEILVRVAKEERPLSVLAIDQIVQAKGTEFTVEITEDHYVEVMVTEGKVVVGIHSDSAPSPSGTDATTPSFAEPPVLAQLAGNTLTAGEEMLLGYPSAAKKIVSSDDIEVKLSWKDGRLIFRSEPLEKALREVERYTAVEFVLLDEGLKSVVITGRFRTGDVETLLELLRINLNINHEFDEESRILLSSR